MSHGVGYSDSTLSFNAQGYSSRGSKTSDDLGKDVTQVTDPPPPA
jgi:hypothetical protein